MRNFYGFLMNRSKRKGGLTMRLSKHRAIPPTPEGATPPEVALGGIMRSTDKFRGIPQMPFNRVQKRDYVRKLIKKGEKHGWKS
jgi:hypothetical protein